MYLTIVSGLKKSEVRQMIKYLWIFSFSLPFILFVIGVSVRAYGQTFPLTIGICLFNAKDDREWYLWIYTYPSLIVNCLAVVVMCYTVYTVTQILLGKHHSMMRTTSSPPKSESTTSDLDIKEKEKDEVKKKWKKMIWYNQRSLLFIVLFCLMNILGLSFIVEIVGDTEGDLEREVTDFLSCLLTVTVPSTESGEKYPVEVCGEPDDYMTHWPKMYYIVYWIEVFFFKINDRFELNMGLMCKIYCLFPIFFS